MGKSEPHCVFAERDAGTSWRRLRERDGILIQITKARDLADFREAGQLIAEMGRWDVAQCDAFGLPSGEVLSTYYSDDSDGLMRKFTQPRSGLYLARDDASAMGCVGHLSDGDNSEITKFFVRTEARGKGIGRGLLSAALEAIREGGPGRIRLVTISFMTDAIALYRGFGFVACEPFAAAPKGLEEATRYMALPSAAA